MILGIPTVGICFGMCLPLDSWRIFWKAIDPRDIPGSFLYSGYLRNSCCIAVQNQNASILTGLEDALLRTPEFYHVCASPVFINGPEPMLHSLLEAGHVDMSGKIEGVAGLCTHTREQGEENQTQQTNSRTQQSPDVIHQHAGVNSFPKRYEEASVLFRNGREEQAIQILDELDAIHPNSPAIMLARATCLYKLKLAAPATALCDCLVRQFNYPGAADLRTTMEMAKTNAEKLIHDLFESALAKRKESLRVSLILGLSFIVLFFLEAIFAAQTKYILADISPMAEALSLASIFVLPLLTLVFISRTTCYSGWTVFARRFVKMFPEHFPAQSTERLWAIECLSRKIQELSKAVGGSFSLGVQARIAVNLYRQLLKYSILQDSEMAGIKFLAEEGMKELALSSFTAFRYFSFVDGMKSLADMMFKRERGRGIRKGDRVRIRDDGTSTLCPPDTGYPQKLLLEDAGRTGTVIGFGRTGDILQVEWDPGSYRIYDDLVLGESGRLEVRDKGRVDLGSIKSTIHSSYVQLVGRPGNLGRNAKAT